MLVLLLLLGLAIFRPSPVMACEQTGITWYNPTGWTDCTRYGVGTASHWQGPGVARNDCLYPWDRCTPIIITSLDTGRSITVVPQMFCGCYVGSSDERIVDLDPAALAALGLDPSRGLYQVRVSPALSSTPTSSSLSLPDTALPMP